MGSGAGHSTPIRLGKRPPPAAAAAPADVSAVPAGDTNAGRVYIETYGCQMNVADSDMVSGMLAGAGYRRTTDPAEADVILVNTCAVRERAEERVYARARELAAHKKRRPGVVLAITGCMAEHLKQDLLARAPHVDIIAGPDSYRRLLPMIDTARGTKDGATQLDVQLDKTETYDGLSGAEGGDGVSGFVTIQRGCDKFCTFCVVPYTRGRERGVPPREVLRQTRAFAERGYKEVVLLGQTVNSYAWEEVGFADLLRAVARIDGIERVRFTSPYPVDFTPEVIEAIASEPKICKYVHLPLQSGSDEVLARMRRGYTVADFRALVATLRRDVPGIALSTDILVGFCGETESDHAATVDLVRELRFDSAFMFAYSERELTYASRKIPDDIPPEVKNRRLREVIALQEQISREINAAQIGHTERILIHSTSRRDEQQVVGRTDGFKSVILPAHAGKPGDLVDAMIERATMATLFATPVAARPDADARVR